MSTAAGAPGDRTDGARCGISHGARCGTSGGESVGNSHEESAGTADEEHLDILLVARCDKPAGDCFDIFPWAPGYMPHGEPELKTY